MLYGSLKDGDGVLVHSSSQTSDIVRKLQAGGVDSVGRRDGSIYDGARRLCRVLACRQLSSVGCWLLLSLASEVMAGNGVVGRLNHDDERAAVVGDDNSANGDDGLSIVAHLRTSASAKRI